ncbi:YbaB/EbfC family nucleoid-associated protein [Actinokineospora sp.]|uniref:YbaB/EbfC family nucleoid-associated protein n=1 Tax=Actinokineospora sp. TaxID=1872133 RepID=UPI0040379DED
MRGMDSLYAEYTQLAQDVRDIRDGLADIRATAHSPDGLISVTVGGRGEVLELVINPRVYREPDSAALAKSITDTIHAATGTAERDALKVAKKLMAPGAGDDADPHFDPLLHQLERHRERGDLPWAM